MNEFRKVHQFNCFTCHTPSQVALAEFLKNKDAYLSLAGFMQKKRDHFIELMKQTKFELLHSSGSYFICAKYDRISDEATETLLYELQKNSAWPPFLFLFFINAGTDNKVIRFCFSKKSETLEAAVNRLIKI